MKDLVNGNMPLVIGVVIFAGVLVAWLIYRNIKDEKNFERNMDDPKQNIEHHHEGGERD